MEKIIIGNIITMDKSMPCAKAAAIRDGIIVCVGSEEEVRKAVSESAEVLDYSDCWVYPGFLESHTHGVLAGFRAIGQADLSMIFPTDYVKYENTIRQFIADNPDKEIYLAAGWVEDGTQLDYKYLDNICADKPLVMNTGGGHACLLNTKAMELFGFDDAAVEKYTTELVHVGADGHPNGYICEGPAIELIGRMPMELKDVKKYLLKWQDMALSKGITAVADAGVELFCGISGEAYKELQDEGKLKLRTYAYMMVGDDPEDSAKEVERVVGLAEEYSGEYFKVIGIKAFLDGVIEAHTGWLIDDYADQAGYHGLERFNNTDKMVKMIVEAEKNGLAVHVHSEGDGAAHFMLDCVEKAEAITGNMDQRNVLAHLHNVSDEDIKKMASTRSVAAVAPLWTAFFPGETDQEIEYIGRERTMNSYPIKSFIDNGATIVYHSDFPISPIMDVARSIFMAEKRGVPEMEIGGPEKTQRNIKEAVTRQQSLEAITANVAYAWHEENRMGSVSVGKLANFAVVDQNFLESDIMDVPSAKVVATIVDGEVVYSAGK